MPAQILDGAGMATTIRAEVAAAAAAFTRDSGIRPCLAVVYGGDDPGTRSYVRSIGRQAERTGLAVRLVALPPGADELALRGHLTLLNADDSVHGVIVMVPLPAGLRTLVVQETLDPRKDVDGITPENAGRVVLNLPGFAPCTPLGGMELLRRSQIDVTGWTATVVGRSATVGRPLATLLTHANATVTICHTRTRDLAGACRNADLLCVATGVPGTVTADMIRPGATVLDFGINPGPAGTLVGDIDYEAARQVAGRLATGPAGTGPMTTAMLLQATLRAAQAIGR